MASSTDAKTIIDKASLLLADVSKSFWLASELLDWLNDGQYEIAISSPNTCSVTAVIHLVAGAKQSAPANSIRLVEFVRNMGLSGTAAGNAIRQVERKVMDRYAPNWSHDNPHPVVVHAMYNAEDDNTTFYVWPPQPATPAYIEVIYSQAPAIIPDSNVGTKITVNDYYQNPLLDYVLYRALGRGTEDTGTYQRSQDHYQRFAKTLGIKLNDDRNANNSGPAK